MLGYTALALAPNGKRFVLPLVPFLGYGLLSETIIRFLSLLPSSTSWFSKVAASCFSRCFLLVRNDSDSSLCNRLENEYYVASSPHLPSLASHGLSCCSTNGERALSVTRERLSFMTSLLLREQACCTWLEKAQ